MGLNHVTPELLVTIKSQPFLSLASGGLVKLKEKVQDTNS